MNAILYDVALTAYIVAMAAALAISCGRRESLWRFALVATQAGWLFHTVAIVVRGVELGRLPILTLPEIVSVVIWAAVLLELWAERQYRSPRPRRLRPPGGGGARAWCSPPGSASLALEPAIRSAWIWVHVALALLGWPPSC